MRRPRATRLLGASAILSVTLCGCVPVHAYERAVLAHPTMAPEYAASPSIEHAQSVHEGPLGGTLQVTSGCGCN